MTWVGVRWARASQQRGHFCYVDAHAPDDYPDPTHGKRVCGVHFPPGRLAAAGGFDECRPDAGRPRCPLCFPQKAKAPK